MSLPARPSLAKTLIRYDIVIGQIILFDTNRLQPLTTKEELMYNSIWRFLHLREYIDSNHRLTAWGKVLHASVGALDGRKELEEPIFLAIELMRLDYLNGKTNFPSYYGPSLRRGSGEHILSVIYRVPIVGG